MAQITERIRKIRKLLNCSQEAFSEVLGISRGHISNLETGTAIPSDQLIKSISRAFGIREEWLRDGKGPMEDSLWNPRTAFKNLEDRLDFVMKGYDSWDDKIKVFSYELESFLKWLSGFKEELRRRRLARLKIPVTEKDLDHYLQNELIDKLHKMRRHISTTENQLILTNIEKSIITILRGLDRQALNSIIVFITHCATYDVDKNRMKNLKQDIKTLREAAKSPLTKR